MEETRKREQARMYQQAQAAAMAQQHQLAQQQQRGQMQMQAVSGLCQQANSRQQADLSAGLCALATRCFADHAGQSGSIDAESESIEWRADVASSAASRGRSSCRSGYAATATRAEPSTPAATARRPTSTTSVKRRTESAAAEHAQWCFAIFPSIAAAWFAAQSADADADGQSADGIAQHAGQWAVAVTSRRADAAFASAAATSASVTASCCKWSAREPNCTAGTPGSDDSGCERQDKFADADATAAARPTDTASE